MTSTDVTHPATRAAGRRPDADRRRHPRLLRQHRRREGHLLDGVPGRDRHPHRGQRRRQVDDDAHDLRAVEAQAWRGSFRRSTDLWPEGHEVAQTRHCPEPGRPTHLSQDDRHRESRARCLHCARTRPGIAADMERVFELFPTSERASRAEGRHPVRWRAADARHGSGPDGRAAAVAARRTVDGFGAGAGRTGLRQRSRRSTTKAPQCCSSSRTRSSR